MTTAKISELTSSSGVSSTDLFLTVVSGAGGYVTRKATGLQLAQFASSSITSLNLSSLTASGISSTNITADTISVDTLTAREYYTQVVSASVIYQSGSTRFGNSADDTHTLTGSVLISGAANLTGDLVASAGQFTSVTGSHVGSGAGLTNIPNVALTNSSVTVGSTAISLGGTATTLTGLTAVTSSAVSGTTAQFTSITGALNGTASYASNADQLDGLDSTAFGRLGSNNTYTAINTFNTNYVTASAGITGSDARFTTITGSTISGKLNSLCGQVTTINSNATLNTSQYVILVNAASTNINITLPNATTAANYQYAIKKIDSSSNSVIISGSNSQTIDGETGISFNTQYEGVVLVNDGNNWFIF